MEGDEEQVEASEVEAQAQELASTAADAAQELASKAEAQAQEPNLAELQGQLAALQKRTRDLEADLSGTKRAKDTEVAAMRRERDEIARQVAEARKQGNLRLAREDPEAFAQVYQESQLAEEQAEKARQELEGARITSWQQANQTIFNMAMDDQHFPMLTYQEKEDAYRATATKTLAQAGRLPNPVEIMNEFAVAATTKASAPLAQLAALEEEVKALRAAQAGNSLRNSGGPAQPIGGTGTGGASYRTLEDAEAAHVRGEISNARMRELRGVLSYARE